MVKSSDKKDSMEPEDMAREIFLESTGLKYVNEKILNAAYKIYKFISSGDYVELIKSEELIVLADDTRDKDALLMLWNLEKLIEKYGYDKYFTIDDAAKELNLSLTIAKRWIDNSVELGLIDETEKNSELVYRFNKQNIESLLTSLELKIKGLKNKLLDSNATLTTRLKQIGDSLMGEKSSIDSRFGSDLPKEFANVIDAIKLELSRISEKEIVNDAELIDLLNSLKSKINSELAFEILNCIRINKLSISNVIALSNNDLEKCKRVLELLKEIE